MDPLFRNAGTLAGAYDQVNWEQTPLGPVESWSPTLRQTVSLCLNTKFPVTLMWGPQFVLVYNEAYARMIADKHPKALGSTAEQIFSEEWKTLGPMLDAVFAGDGAVWQQDIPLFLTRNGILEETVFTFSYSPVLNEHGEIEGALDIATETTQQVVAIRRLELLGRLSAIANTLTHPNDLANCALPMLHRAMPDLPAVDIIMPGQRPNEHSFWREVPHAIPGDEVIVQNDMAGRVAWMRLPGSKSVEQPLLIVQLSNNLRFDPPYRDFLQLIAASLGNAFALAQSREQERNQMHAIWSMSEALQRSLLTETRQPEFTEVAVRYVPATQEAQIGGDWYDAFTTAASIPTFVIGDVAGHDQHAAAAMGQVRNVLRGIAYTISDPPGIVLSALDRAMRDLEIRTLSTAILATVEPRYGKGHVDMYELRWTNAGHPPPILVHADGTAEKLTSKPDVLLGVDSGYVRSDHSRMVEKGATVLLYTDGLIERRGRSLEDSITQLAGVAANVHDKPLEKFCDAILEEVAVDAEDDIALLAVRLR